MTGWVNWEGGRSGTWSQLPRKNNSPSPLFIGKMAGWQGGWFWGGGADMARFFELVGKNSFFPKSIFFAKKVDI